METATTRANLQRYCMALVKSGLSTPLRGMTTSSIKEPIKDAEYVVANAERMIQKTISNIRAYLPSKTSFIRRRKVALGFLAFSPNFIFPIITPSPWSGSHRGFCTLHFSP